ncbi:MAG TPA: MotA/TolQ/ExbB proton channel family protein [Turneriella sp.]|nr:MotA/TolQ/ExbB proton channel family protein [Turneriella sp.]
MRMRILFVIFLLSTASTFLLRAQNPSTPTVQNTTNDTVNPPETSVNTAIAQAGEWHFGSDPTVWVMIFIFNLALFVVLERVYVLRRVRGDAAHLVDYTTEAIAKGEAISTIAENAADARYGLEGRIAAASLKGWDKGEHAMKEYAEATLIGEKRRLEKRLVILSTLGNNTPFIGLLGTVLGIMKAFRDLSTMGDAGPAVVMRGISEALIATAMGLAVAIPVVIAYNALSRMVQDKISQADEIATLLRAIRLNK